MTLPPIILLIEYYSPAFHLLGTPTHSSSCFSHHALFARKFPVPLLFHLIPWWKFLFYHQAIPLSHPVPKNVPESVCPKPGSDTAYRYAHGKEGSLHIQPRYHDRTPQSILRQRHWQFRLYFSVFFRPERFCICLNSTPTEDSDHCLRRKTLY